MSDQLETVVMASSDIEAISYNNALMETFIMNDVEFETLFA